MPYVRINNQAGFVRDPIGGGLEGDVFNHLRDPSLVIKVHRKPTPELEAKLTYLKDNPPQVLRDPSGAFNYAWVLGLVYNATGQVIGSELPKIPNSIPLAQIVSPIDRPKWNTFQFRIHIARQLCERVADLHSVGYVRGDLNLTNDLLTQSGHLVPIDLDSMQIRTTTHVLRCEVGHPDFSSPRLLAARDYKSIDRTVADDLWAMAVLVFLLLMDGEHPFNLFWNSHTMPKPSRSELIQGGYFPYSGKHIEAEPPHGGPDFGRLLDSELQNLFLLTFDEGHADPDKRPTAREWVAVLESLDRPQRFHISGRDWARMHASTSSPQVTPSPPSSFATFVPPPDSLFARVIRVAVPLAVAASLLLSITFAGRWAWRRFFPQSPVAVPTEKYHTIGELLSSHEPHRDNRPSASPRTNPAPSVRLTDLPKPTGPPNQPVLWKALSEKKERP